MHLDEENFRRLQTGEEFPGADALAAHLESRCPRCEAFLNHRRPESGQHSRMMATAEAATRSLARVPALPPARLSRSMRTENLALLLTDIAGYTARTSRQSRAENERLLQLHEALLLPVFRAFDGIVRKSIGDAFLVTFASPTNAVLCGAAIQDRLFSFNQTAPEPDRFEVRVVVNIGEVRALPDDVFGEPVNVAKGLEEIAEAREVTFTEAVYLVMNKAEVPSVELGQFALKGVAEPVKLFKIPRGAGKLASGAAPGSGESLLPFSSLGLSRAGNLPAPDLPTLERQLVARQSRRAVKALALRFLKSPKGIRVALGTAGAVLVVLGLVVLQHARTPAIERAIRAGELAQARALIEKLPDGPQRAFWQARLEEQQHHWRDAIEDYAGAARNGPSLVEPAIDRLGHIARDGDCSAKERVAETLGKLGESYGKGVLEDLADEPPQESGGLAGLFGGKCDPAAEARQSLAKLAR